VDGDRVQHPLAGRAADLAFADGVVGDALQDLERVPVLAAVFVDRHGGGKSRLPLCPKPQTR
jgi:hypothetical protein